MRKVNSGEILFSALLTIFIAVICVYALDYKPKVRLVPMLVGIISLMISILVLINEIYPLPMLGKIKIDLMGPLEEKERENERQMMPPKMLAIIGEGEIFFASSNSVVNSSQPGLGKPIALSSAPLPSSTTVGLAYPPFSSGPIDLVVIAPQPHLATRTITAAVTPKIPEARIKGFFNSIPQRFVSITCFCSFRNHQLYQSKIFGRIERYKGSEKSSGGVWRIIGTKALSPWPLIAH